MVMSRRDQHDKKYIAYWKDRIRINVEKKDVESAQVGQRVLKQVYGIDYKFTVNGKVFSYEDQNLIGGEATKKEPLDGQNAGNLPDLQTP